MVAHHIYLLLVHHPYLLGAIAPWLVLAGARAVVLIVAVFQADKADLPAIVCAAMRVGSRDDQSRRP